MHAASGQRAAHVNDPLLSVDVAPLEREPFLRTQARASGEDDDRAIARCESGEQLLELVPGGEDAQLFSLRLWIRYRLGRVLLEVAPAHAGAQDLAEGLQRVVRAPAPESAAPHADLLR